jgi:hypothetical protein
MEILMFLFVAGIFLTGVMFGSAVTVILLHQEARKKKGEKNWVDKIDEALGI